MRLVLDTDPQSLTIRRYGPGEVEVGEHRLRAPFIVSATRLVSDWPVTAVGELDLAALAPLLALRPSIVLIGSDEIQARLPRDLRRALEERSVAIEVMALGAACRTYNVLVQERREVVAGLWP